MWVAFKLAFFHRNTLIYVHDSLQESRELDSSLPLAIRFSSASPSSDFYLTCCNAVTELGDV